MKRFNLLAIIALVVLTEFTPIKAQERVSVYVNPDSIPVEKVINPDSIWFMNNIVNPDSINIVDWSLRKLVYALIYVESRGNDKVSNKSGTCIGCLQETKTLVCDVNRILKAWKINRSYTYSDRKNRVKSIEMFMIIVKYYHKNSSWEKIAKAWNQGLGGMYIYPQRAQAYWNLVKQALKKIK